MLLEDGLDGLLHCARRRNLHYLGDLIREVHFKHVPLVRLEDIQMLQEGKEENDKAIQCTRHYCMKKYRYLDIQAHNSTYNIKP